MSTCKRASFRADIREVTCDTCAISADVMQGYGASVPALSVPWFGKCYTNCPAGVSRCKAACKQPAIYSTYTGNSLSGCTATPSCGSPGLGRFCEATSSPCPSNQYLDLFSLAAAYHSFTNGFESSYCLACPPGCSSCILQAHEVLCTSCDFGYD